MSKVLKNILLILFSAASFASLVWLLAELVPEPPVYDLERARNAISGAGRERADIYSRKQFNEAKAMYDSAMANWKRENERFIYLRDYSKVEEFANLALKAANSSGNSSQSSSTNLKTAIVIKISELKSLINDINELFTSYPLSPETRNRISKGRFLVSESEMAYKKGDLLVADRKLNEAEYLLSSSFDNANQNLESYFNEFPQWKRWVEKTIADSKASKDYAIVVDKFARKLYIYHSGVKKYEYSAELGKNWVGDKRVRGDMATPEGLYKISKKFDGAKTKYYKALLLNYPNDEDTARFREEIASGTLPHNAKIGGLIEIHGDGGKGIDWTEGCIALTNKEMDLIYKIIKVGTPVTIVGSLVKLDEILKN